MEYNSLIKKLDSLGIEKSEGADKKNTTDCLQKLGSRFDKLPPYYVELCEKIGSFGFGDFIIVSMIEKSPFNDPGNTVSVDDFISCGEAIELLKDYEEQLPRHLLPVFHGGPGDFVCVSLDAEKYGKIYYWHHESNPSKDTYLIANSFDEFIQKLQKEPEDDKKGSSDVKVLSISPDFLALLNQDESLPKGKKDKK